MFICNLPLFCLLLHLSTITTTTLITAQSYKATDHFLLNCGSPSSTSFNDREWEGEAGASKFVTSDITRNSFSSTAFRRGPSVPEIPYSTARIFNTSSFTYTFPVSQGPKFLRLFFYPAAYSGLNPDQSFFSVSSNGFSLLTNFSAFLTASYLGKARDDAGIDGPSVPHFVKEFIIYVKDTTKILNVTFTPSPNSYAFINGMEIVSIQENLYFNAKKPRSVGMDAEFGISNDMAVESIYRLNMGGGQISGDGDTGMYRSWDQDNIYIYGAATGLTHVYLNPITYTMETPNYSAPELVYQTQRSMGQLSKYYNLTWILPVDSGFYYMLRLHFCNIIPYYTKINQVAFKIFINNQTAEDQADLFGWTPGGGYPLFKDYVVFVNDPDDHKGKQDLWLALHPNTKMKPRYLDAYLNGLEVFKLSMNHNLPSPNPELSSEVKPRSGVSSIEWNKKKTPSYPTIIGGVGGGLILLSLLLVIVLRVKRRVKHHSSTNDKPSCDQIFSNASLPSDRCRSFTLKEVKFATDEFNENCVIGNGGFGKVYKGYIDTALTTVAIKRLNKSSSQGLREFLTKIGLLSKLRHVHLVSLIGYCNEDGEMALVYDYMAQGTPNLVNS